jgi:hypothetical protein
LLAVTLAVFACCSIVAALERQVERVLLQANTRSINKEGALTHSHCKNFPLDSKLPCAMQFLAQLGALASIVQCSCWSSEERSRQAMPCRSTSMLHVGLAMPVHCPGVNCCMQLQMVAVQNPLHVFSAGPKHHLTSRSSSPGRGVTHSAKLSTRLGTFAPCTLLLRVPFCKQQRQTPFSRLPARQSSIMLVATTYEHSPACCAEAAWAASMLIHTHLLTHPVHQK